MAAISIDGTPMTALPSDADQINYDNTSSGLSATQVQDAIDELALEKKDEYETITYAQWQAMTPTQQAAKDYYISDYPSSAITAGNVSYNNSSSGMVANNVQSAVDELKSGLTNLGTYTDCSDVMQFETGVTIAYKYLCTNNKELYGTIVLDISQVSGSLIGTILSGYRPINAWRIVSMSYATSSDAGSTSIVTLDVNGEVLIDHTAGKPYLLFSFTYPIGN